MYGINIKKIKMNFSKYTELRIERNSQYIISIVNGIVITNFKSINSGVSARVYDSGNWGFAADYDISEESIKNVIKKAEENAAFLSLKTNKKIDNFYYERYYCDKNFLINKKDISKKECVEYGKQVYNYIKNRYKEIENIIVDMVYEDSEKEIICSYELYYHGILPRTTMNITIVTSKDGRPIEINEKFGGIGSVGDKFENLKIFYGEIDILCKRLIDKKNGVYAKSGEKECIFSSNVAGLMAHEAIGHMLEGDSTINGIFKQSSVGKKVATSKFTLIDFANTAFGKNCPVPLYVDDEGTKCEDVIAIEKGILKEFMCNKEMATQLGIKPKGNARVENFYDEPVISMRNTCIMPYKDKVEDMIASIEDGYYLIKTTSSKVDINSQFITGIKCGYEIKNGKLGKAILNTSISGDVQTFLSSISMIGSDFEWLSGGMCSKKTLMRVGMGAPSIKCKVNIGGV